MLHGKNGLVRSDGITVSQKKSLTFSGFSDTPRRFQHPRDFLFGAQKGFLAKFGSFVGTIFGYDLFLEISTCSCGAI